MALSSSTILPGLSLRQSPADGTQHPVNSYIWDGPHGLLVIDPGAALVPDVTLSDGSFASDVTLPAALFVTHLQREHVAGAEHFPGVPLYVPAGDEYLCKGAAAYADIVQKWEAPWTWDSRGNFPGHLAGARNERPPDRPLAVAGSLCEGDEVLGLRVLSTPGHGKHAVTLLADIQGRRMAFCGDLIYGDGRLWNWFDCDWDYGLQSGQRAVLASAQRLLNEKPDVLLPAHGDAIVDATGALRALIARLQAVLGDAPNEAAVVNFRDNESPVPGWRRLSPHLYQWKAGNCALLVSRAGAGLLVDDGLCRWLPLEERAPDQQAVMEAVKTSLGLSRIEAVLVTHYHGDHVNNIPTLVADEGAEVVALDTVADVMENERAYNLAAPLWWYGDSFERVPVDRRLADGETFGWREYELNFFHLGGQTYYHAGITAQIDGSTVCFVGDAVWGWTARPEPVLCFNDAEPATRGWAYAVDRILEQRPDLLVCGHGSALRDPMSMLEEKRENWQRQLERFDALNARPSRRAFFDPFWEGEMSNP